MKMMSRVVSSRPQREKEDYPRSRAIVDLWPCRTLDPIFLSWRSRRSTGCWPTQTSLSAAPITWTSNPIQVGTTFPSPSQQVSGTSPPAARWPLPAPPWVRRLKPFPQCGSCSRAALTRLVSGGGWRGLGRFWTPRRRRQHQRRPHLFRRPPPRGARQPPRREPWPRLWLRLPWQWPPRRGLAPSLATPVSQPPPPRPPLVAVAAVVAAARRSCRGP